MTVAEALATVRGHTRKLARLGQLGWADADDLAAELLAASLAEARTVPGALRLTDARWTRVGGKDRGRPADVLAWIDRAEREAPLDSPSPMLRTDHTRAAWVKLEAKSYRRRLIARRESAADDALPDMEAEDFTEAEAEAPRPVSPAGCLIEALKLCHLAELPDTCREAIAAGLYPGESQDLARAAGCTVGTFWNRASKGAAIVRESYPDPTDLADLIDRNVSRRRTPLAGRRIGAALPESGDRHRTAPQMAREADVLIAREQRPGRKATAAKLPDSGCRVLPAPDHWQTWRRVDYLLPAAVLRRIAERLAVADMPKSGARPHRAAHGLPAHGLTGCAEPAPRIHTPTTREARPWIIRDAQVKGWNAH